jgi:hypothetical protein
MLRVKSECLYPEKVDIMELDLNDWKKSHLYVKNWVD